MRSSRHAGWRVERCRYNFRERVFAEEWIKENRKQSGINFGQGILQDLFGIRTLWAYGWRLIVSRRDAFIVATVVQWFGTNCGWCFLERCVNRCGFKLVPTADKNWAEYYDPWYQDKMNASAWYNSATRGRFRGFGVPEPDELPFKRVTPVFKRRHLVRDDPGPRNYNSKHCIRCGWEAPTGSDPYYVRNRLTPPCEVKEAKK